MRRALIPRPLRLTLALGLLALGGCLGGSTEPVSVSGVYALQTINGKALPFTFSNNVTVSQETFTIFADGTFSDVTVRTDGTTVADQGVYSNFGGTINFADQTVGFAYQGIVTGSRLSIAIGSYASEFTRTGAAVK